MSKSYQFKICYYSLFIINSGYAFESSDGYFNYSPFRLLGTIGSPSFVSAEVECILPKTHGVVSIWSEFGDFPVGETSKNIDGVNTESSTGYLKNIGIGVNVYPFQNGRGLFLQSGYNKMDAATKINSLNSKSKYTHNPTHIIPLQIGYRYIGSYFTYSFSGGYGVNIKYDSPDDMDKDDVLFKKGDWYLFEFTWGFCLPFSSPHPISEGF